MKKLICYLSVIALMVMATGCKGDKMPPVRSSDNDGDENVLYSFHTILQGFCGGTVFNANNQLLSNGFTQVSTGNYRLMADAYMISVTLEDNNSDELVEVIDVTIEPSEVTHKELLTFDYIKQFVILMGDRVKLFSSNYYCDFCGFYNASGTWMSLDNYQDIFTEVDENNIDGGKFYWIEESYTEFAESIQANPQYTGMYMQPDYAEVAGNRSETEFSVHINYIVNADI